MEPGTRGGRVTPDGRRTSALGKLVARLGPGERTLPAELGWKGGLGSGRTDHLVRMNRGKGPVGVGGNLAQARDRAERLGEGRRAAGRLGDATPAAPPRAAGARRRVRVALLSRRVLRGLRRRAGCRLLARTAGRAEHRFALRGPFPVRLRLAARAAEARRGPAFFDRPGVRAEGTVAPALAAKHVTDMAGGGQDPQATGGEGRPTRHGSEHKRRQGGEGDQT